MNRIAGLYVAHSRGTESRVARATGSESVLGGATSSGEEVDACAPELARATDGSAVSVETVSRARAATSRADPRRW
jgi:hypothetical protein